MNHLLKTLTLSVLITIGFLAQQAQAQSGLTLAQYREWKKDPIKKEMLTTYTAGMGQGVVFSNVHNKSFNLTQIFCPPGVTCPGIFRPSEIRDNGSLTARSSDEESTIYRRADRSHIARS